MNNNTIEKEIKVCSVEGCGGKVLARSLCNKHYKKVWRKEKEVKYCEVRECNNKEFARGYCSKHYRINVRGKCKVDGCRDNVNSKGYCTKHYHRYRKYGDVTIVKSKKVIGICNAEGCSREIDSIGYCTKHYQRFLKHGTTSAEPLSRIMEHDGKCSVKGCDGEFWAKNLCKTHYNRQYKKSYMQTERGREILRNSVIRRRARKRNSPINDFNIKQWRECLNHFDNKCAYCGKQEEVLQREHVIPVSRGGSNTKTNIIPSCGSCNYSKGDKTIFEWYCTSENYSEERNNKILKYLGYKIHKQNIQMQLF